jgi:hypothetical protein
MTLFTDFAICLFLFFCPLVISAFTGNFGLSAPLDFSCQGRLFLFAVTIVEPKISMPSQ